LYIQQDIVEYTCSGLSHVKSMSNPRGRSLESTITFCTL